jgi:hypothetical protein
MASGRQVVAARFPEISLRPGVRLLLLSVILTFIQPAPTLVTPGPPQKVYSEHPIVGVHTRLTDEVEEWKIQRTLQMVREMGAVWIIEFFPWAYYQGEDGRIAWNHPDMVINHATAQGLSVIARIGLTPAWARPEGTSLNYLDVDAYDDFAQFAAAFAARYQGQVKFIVVGNEPNLSFEWGFRQTAPQDYADLLKIVHAGVKEANPDMGVLAAGLAPTLEPAGSPWGLNDIAYLEGLYQAGAADYFDGLAVHTYGFTFPPDSAPDSGILNFRRVELLRQVMVEYGDAETPIFITETGWNDHPRWTRSVKPGQRIRYTLDALRFAEEQWPFVEVLGIWAFRYPVATKSYMDYYTLVTPEFVAKPLYDEIKRYTGN